MRRPHLNVATVLVEPAVLRDLELDLAGLDLWVWPIATTPNCPDGPRMAFQIRRRLAHVPARAGNLRRDALQKLRHRAGYRQSPGGPPLSRAGWIARQAPAERVVDEVADG